MTDTMIATSPSFPQFLLLSLAGFGLVFLYFLPTWFSILSRRPNPAAMLLNLTLGWTILGWMTAIVWAAEERAPEPVSPEKPSHREGDGLERVGTKVPEQLAA